MIQKLEIETKCDFTGYFQRVPTFVNNHEVWVSVLVNFTDAAKEKPYACVLKSITKQISEWKTETK